MSILRETAAEFGVPFAFVLEVERRYGLHGSPVTIAEDEVAHSESYAQSQVRLEAPKFGVMLTRNNVGACQDEYGNHIRYGLFNESKKQNKRIKSWDLVGYRKRLITQAMVGTIIGQFVGREIKHPGWVYTGDEHEQAQLRCTELALSYGCDVGFATGPGSFRP
ncbi:hypothetical protein Psp6_00021 [Pseudomonas phage Psp6]|nr:hypothetical protein Psp6_00021 [Pseudomonas phage Psp6]